MFLGGEEKAESLTVTILIDSENIHLMEIILSCLLIEEHCRTFVDSVRTNTNKLLKLIFLVNWVIIFHM